MMGSTVVVSVQYAGGLRRDLELPVNIPMASLAPNIAQAIHSIDREADERAYKCMLKRLKTGEILNRERSLADYAVNHGEILQLVLQARPTRSFEVGELPRFNGPGFIDSAGAVFRIEAPRAVIGRADPLDGELDSCVNLDLTPVDTLEAPSVSETHAEIVFQSDQFLLRPLPGGGATVVNLRRLESNQPVSLRHGDHVSFGDVKLVFVWDGRNPSWS